MREAVAARCAAEGFAVAAYGDGPRDAEEILAQAPDLAVLDVMLGAATGSSWRVTLRAARDLPVVFLTARDAVADRVGGLRARRRRLPGQAVRARRAARPRARGAAPQRAGYGAAIEAGDVLVDEQAGRRLRAGRRSS